jgi:nucleotide-binding universal stress UspA family protein
MYTQILVAYDGSALSDKALAEAARLAQPGRARVTLLYVLTPHHLLVGGGRLVPGLKELEGQHAEMLRQEAREMLARAHGRLTAADIPCEVLLEEGSDPYEHIVRAASRLNCDLVVMASHGRRGIEGLVVGSQTIKVLSHSKLPVLVVR